VSATFDDGGASRPDGVAGGVELTDQTLTATRTIEAVLFPDT
jgi:hypothetical protein